MIDRRQTLLHGLDVAHLTGLEIGPLMSPFVGKSDGDVIYVDHADTATLREKYAGDPAVDTSRIVEVDAVWGEQTLAECLYGRKVDYVIASHVAEHVPDLVTWLQEIEQVLRPGGELRLIVPDKRFTFDCLREEARFTDLIHAYLMRARQPLPHAVLDCVLDVAANADAQRIADGSQRPEDIERTFSCENALTFVRDSISSGRYVDVHCWVVTPHRFAELLERAAAVGLIRFCCGDFVDTAPGSPEFFVTLKRTEDRHEAVQSWRRMAEVAVSPTPAVPTPSVSDGAMIAELGLLRRRVAAIDASTSWRVTAPIRACAHALRRLRLRPGNR